MVAARPIDHAVRMLRGGQALAASAIDTYGFFGVGSFAGPQAWSPRMMRAEAQRLDTTRRRYRELQQPEVVVQRFEGRNESSAAVLGGAASKASAIADRPGHSARAHRVRQLCPRARPPDHPPRHVDSSSQHGDAGDISVLLHQRLPVSEIHGALSFLQFCDSILARRFLIAAIVRLKFRRCNSFAYQPSFAARILPVSGAGQCVSRRRRGKAFRAGAEFVPPIVMRCHGRPSVLRGLRSHPC